MTRFERELSGALGDYWKRHAEDDRGCEAEIGLRAVSEVEFEDDGHAIAWAMRQ